MLFEFSRFRCSMAIKHIWVGGKISLSLSERVMFMLLYHLFTSGEQNVWKFNHLKKKQIFITTASMGQDLITTYLGAFGSWSPLRFHSRSWQRLWSLLKALLEGGITFTAPSYSCWEALVPCPVCFFIGMLHTVAVDFPQGNQNHSFISWWKKWQITSSNSPCKKEVDDFSSHWRAEN